jgi:hypothetical protein
MHLPKMIVSIFMLVGCVATATAANEMQCGQTAYLALTKSQTGQDRLLQQATALSELFADKSVDAANIALEKAVCMVLDRFRASGDEISSLVQSLRNNKCPADLVADVSKSVHVESKLKCRQGILYVAETPVLPPHKTQASTTGAARTEDMPVETITKRLEKIADVYFKSLRASKNPFDGSVSFETQTAPGGYRSVATVKAPLADRGTGYSFAASGGLIFGIAWYLSMPIVDASVVLETGAGRATMVVPRRQAQEWAADFMDVPLLIPGREMREIGAIGEISFLRAADISDLERLLGHSVLGARSEVDFTQKSGCNDKCIAESQVCLRDHARDPLAVATGCVRWLPRCADICCVAAGGKSLGGRCTPGLP